MKKWLEGAVFYEVYPATFKDTDADGIGDLEGIIQKLDYIKDTGFTAIWMNPCFESPFADGGYDISDFYKVAPRYGTNDDLKRLFDEVHKRDMHIMLDLVAGHTSIECEWFKASMKFEKNKYSGRYIWTDSVWKSFDGIASINGALRGIAPRDGCCAVNFFSTQPALNYGFANVTEPWQSSPDSEDAVATREELMNIMRFWLDMGCDGFRVDLASTLVKNDDDKSETIKLWQKIFKVINAEYPNAAFISEWGDPEQSLAGGFDMDFLLHTGRSHYTDMYHNEKPYFSKDGVGSAKEFFDFYVDCLEKTKGKGLISLPSGNHDLTRVGKFCDAAELKLVYAFMMSMPGVPFVYNGDEIGMKFIPNLRSVEGSYSRTGSRTPMQWDNSLKNCGFSDAETEKLYNVMDVSESRPTVAAQLCDTDSVLNELKKQISVRKSVKALQETAELELISSDYPLIYKRYTDDEEILVVINPLERDTEVSANVNAFCDVIYQFGKKSSIKDGIIKVPALSASYIRLK